MNRLLNIYVACVVVPIGPLSGQHCDRAAAYVRLVGSDTVALELTAVHDGMAKGAMLLLPERIRVEYSADIRFAPDSSHLMVALWDSTSGGKSTPDQKGELFLYSQSAVYRAWRGPVHRALSFEVPASTLPLYPLAVGLEELVLQQGHALGRLQLAQRIQIIAAEGPPLVARIRYGDKTAHMDLDEMHADYSYDDAKAL